VKKKKLFSIHQKSIKYYTAEIMNLFKNEIRNFKNEIAISKYLNTKKHKRTKNMTRI